jgi:hypothetical protein
MAIVLRKNTILLVISLILMISSYDSYILCPNGRACPDGNRCCVTSGGYYNCCPQSYECCDSGLKCCFGSLKQLNSIEGIHQNEINSKDQLVRLHN